MLLAWRRLLHGVITVAMDGLPDAILAPKDQGGSDHQLGRLRPARELPPPALDEDPVSHVAGRRQEGGVARDLARTGHELRRHPESQRSLTSAQPCSDRKSTRLNSSHANISYAVFCLKKKI